MAKTLKKPLPTRYINFTGQIAAALRWRTFRHGRFEPKRPPARGVKLAL
jgi:hypothetical protein